ncbi:MAG: diguanylate cyclase [Solirubrobacterales bacterium]
MPSRSIWSPRLVAGAVLALVVIVGAVSLAASSQRRSVETIVEQTRAGEKMLTGMLDQQTGLRGFRLTAKESFLTPYESGRRNFAVAINRARQGASDDAEAKQLLATQARRAAIWQRLAIRDVARIRRTDKPDLDAEALQEGRDAMNAFRSANGRYQRRLDRRRAAQLRKVEYVPAAIILVLGGIFSAITFMVLSRSIRRDREREDADEAYRRSQRELTAALQATRDEPEAHELLCRHLERSTGGTATIQQTKSSADSMSLLRSAEAGSRSPCLAVRLGADYERTPHVEPLMACDICGQKPGASTCRPLLVGGETFGSVLLSHGGELEAGHRRHLEDSVEQAAPVLANLRNLTRAEARARTDALTGLPNRRAFDDELRRLVAHAKRNGSAVTAMLIDIDHFKSLNDTYGHERGDEALATVAKVLADTVRTSDFVARYGGEEFVALLPDTDRTEAAVPAEKLRRAVSEASLSIDRQITISVGVACFPPDGMDPHALLRSADRALYAAKEAGRDRVELAPEPEPPVDEVAPAGS